MTIERAIDMGVAAVAASSTTAVALAKGTSMDQWLMWGLTTLVGAAAAYGTFRVTTENRLAHLEAHAETTATSAQIVAIQGDIQALRQAQEHRREMFDRMDRRIEQIAERLGA